MGIEVFPVVLYNCWEVFPQSASLFQLVRQQALWGQPIHAPPLAAGTIAVWAVLPKSFLTADWHPLGWAHPDLPLVSPRVILICGLCLPYQTCGW